MLQYLVLILKALLRVVVNLILEGIDIYSDFCNVENILIFLGLGLISQYEFDKFNVILIAVRLIQFLILLNRRFLP